MNIEKIIGIAIFLQANSKPYKDLTLTEIMHDIEKYPPHVLENLNIQVEAWDEVQDGTKN